MAEELQLTPSRYRILIADHVAKTRRRLRKAIEAGEDMRVSGEVDSREAFLEALVRSEFDLAIVAGVFIITVGGGSAIKSVVQLRPGLPILSVIDEPSVRMAADACRSGARGFVCRSESDEALRGAVRTVVGGGIHVSALFPDARLFRALIAPRSDTALAIRRLSGREFEIFRLIGVGYSTSKIAELLEAGRKTIETHRSHITNKLDLPEGVSLQAIATQWVAGLAAEAE